MHIPDLGLPQVDIDARMLGEAGFEQLEQIIHTRRLADDVNIIQ